MLMYDGDGSKDELWSQASKTFYDISIGATNHSDPVSNLSDGIEHHQQSDQYQKYQQFDESETTTISTLAKTDKTFYSNNGRIFGPITPPFSPIDIDFLSKSLNATCVSDKSGNSCNRNSDLSLSSRSANIKSEMSSNPLSSALSTVTPPTILNTNGGSTIPVGIAIARQRTNQDIEPQHNQTILTCASYQTKNSTPTRFFDMSPGIVTADSTAVFPGLISGTILGGDSDLRNNAFTTWMHANTFNSTQTPSTFWHYPTAFTTNAATTASMDHMLSMPIQVPPMGYQLVRNPSTGHFLVLSNQMPQTYLWPNCNQTTPQSPLIYPPIQPHPFIPISATVPFSTAPFQSVQPLQIINTPDYWSTSAMLHQPMQTQNTRLIALSTADPKEKLAIPTPQVDPVQFPTDIGINSHDTKILVLPQQNSAISCNLPVISNVCNYRNEPVVKEAETNNNHIIVKETRISTSPVPALALEPEPEPEPVDVAISATCLTPPPEVVDLSTIKINSNNGGVKEIQSDSNQKHDLSNLELLSNSIMDFVSHSGNGTDELSSSNVLCEVVEDIKNEQKFDEKSDLNEKKPVIDEDTSAKNNSEISSHNSANDNIGGLNLLCVLAEEMYQKEVKIQQPQLQPQPQPEQQQSVVEDDQFEENDQKNECESKLSQKFGRLNQESVKNLSKLFTMSNEKQITCHNEKSIDFKTCLISLQEKYKLKQLRLSAKAKSTDKDGSGDHVALSRKRRESHDSGVPSKKFKGSKRSSKLKHKSVEKSEESRGRYSYETDNSNENKYTKSESKKSNKFRPKLKAEPKLKSHPEEDESIELSKRWYDRHSNPSSVEGHNKCVLRESDLKRKNLRVIALFNDRLCSGTINVTQLPDIYEFHLDDKRINKPQHVTTEEVFKTMMLEICPKSVTELTVGCRICARWSCQKSDYYPGKVLSMAEDNLNDDEVPVSFDDGDMRSIMIDQIRLLNPAILMPDFHTNNKPKKSKKKHKKKRKYSGSDEGGGGGGGSSSGSPKRHKHKKHKKRSDRPDAQPAVRSECSNGKIRLKISYAKPANLPLDMLEGPSTSNMACDAPEPNADNQEQNKDETCRAESAESVEEVSEVEAVQDVDSEINEAVDVDPKPEERRSPSLAPYQNNFRWQWASKSIYKKGGKTFYSAIIDDKIKVEIGDIVAIVPINRMPPPYIGQVQNLYEINSEKRIETKWFYHPSDLVPLCGHNLVEVKGAVFRSEHTDDLHLTTVMFKCESYTYREFKELENVSKEVERFQILYDAGFYDIEQKRVTYASHVPRHRGNFRKLHGKPTNCTQDELFVCAQPLQVLQDSGLSLVDNKTVLNSIICPNLKNAVICVTRYTKNCMNFETGKSFQSLFGDTNGMVQRLCHNKSFQNEYLLHTKCMKQVSNNNKQCFQQYESVLREVTSDPSNHDNVRDLSNVKKVCCSLKQYIDCSSTSVEKLCGPVASEFARNFLSNMSYTLNDVYCRNFTQNCEKSSSSLRFECSAILIFAILMIALICQINR